MSNLPTKIRVFEYALLRLVEWHIEVQQQRHFQDFFGSNNFTRVKVLLLPFFLCTATRNREMLFGLFDHFVAADFGHMEVDLRDQVRQAVYLVAETHHLSANPIFLHQFGFQRQMTQKLRTELALGNAHYFDEVDFAVAALKSRDKLFITFDEEALQYYSKRHLSWQLFWDISQKAKESIPIPGDLLINEHSMLAKSPDKRILV